METIKDLIERLNKIRLGCGVKLDSVGFCAYQGKTKWRMCSKCQKSYDKVSLEISTLRGVVHEIDEFIKSDIGFGGVQTEKFEKLKLRITG